MSLLLCLETATTVCSVALFRNGQLLHLEETDQGYTHAENLHLFIQKALQRGGAQPADLSAVAISRGPGSYTGLRIGTSAAKGLCFALGIPLIAVDTLQAMSFGVRSSTNAGALFCPMLDARRMEVYTAIYDETLQAVRPVEAVVIDEAAVKLFPIDRTIFFFGDGMDKCRQLLTQLPNAHFLESIQPSAAHIGALAWEKFTQKQVEDVAYYEPLYLKEFLIKKKANQGRA